MAYNEELNQEILKRADIVKVVSSFLPVSKKGKNYVAKCPFHDDNNPSFTISPEKRMCHCFVCGTGGNAITFVQKYLKIPYSEAMRKTAEIIGFNDPRLEGTISNKPKDTKKEALLKCLRDLSLYYSYALNTPEGKEGLDYFEARHLDNVMRDKYKLGYAYKDGGATINFLTSRGHSLKSIEDAGISQMLNGSYIDKNEGRVIFPICDIDGEVIGFSARRLNNDASVSKYVNTQETYLFHKSNVLYNYHIAKDKARIAGHIYVLEGFMDVFALAKIGIDNAVAIMGTALTVEHIELLRRLNVEVRMCLDGDLPGQTATLKNAKLLEDHGLKVLIVDNQGSTMDPDEILNSQGEEALRLYLNNLLNRIEFALNYYQRSNPLKTSEQKKQLIKQFIPVLVGLKSRLDFDNYIRKLSQITGYDMESLQELVARTRQNQNDNPEVIIRDFHPERKALRRLELAERELLYQMLNNPEATAFFEENNCVFVDNVYRGLANFIIEYAQDHPDYIPIDMLSALENSELENKDELIQEFTTLYLEKNHPTDCNKALLDNLLDSINDEREKIFEKDTLEESLKGKDPLEQARILSEYNRRKMKNNK